MKWSDTKLLRSPLIFLETQAWAKRFCAPDSGGEDGIDEDCSLAEVKEAVEQIAAHFRIPLEAKGVSTCHPTG